MVCTLEIFTLDTNLEAVVIFFSQGTDSYFLLSQLTCLDNYCLSFYLWQKQNKIIIFKDLVNARILPFRV